MAMVSCFKCSRLCSVCKSTVLDTSYLNNAVFIIAWFNLANPLRNETHRITSNYKIFINDSQQLFPFLSVVMTPTDNLADHPISMNIYG